MLLLVILICSGHACLLSLAGKHIQYRLDSGFIPAVFEHTVEHIFLIDRRADKRRVLFSVNAENVDPAAAFKFAQLTARTDDNTIPFILSIKPFSLSQRNGRAINGISYLNTFSKVSCLCKQYILNHSV